MALSGTNNQDRDSRGKYKPEQMLRRLLTSLLMVIAMKISLTMLNHELDKMKPLAQGFVMTIQQDAPRSASKSQLELA